MTPRREYRSVALFLSLLTPGLGQLYNGQLRKAIIAYIASICLSILIGGNAFASFKTVVMCFAIVIPFSFCIAAEAIYSAIKLKEIQLRQYNRWYVYLVIILIISFSTALYVQNIMHYKAFVTPSGAMSPSLVPGDRFIVDKHAYKVGEPKKGDIIVFRYPVDPSKNFIKRIIGTQGDKIEIVDKVVKVNDKVQSENYIEHSDTKILASSVGPRDNFGPVIVPPNSVFVMGDNRDQSYDSRFWGFVDVSAIKGKAKFIYWSEDRSRIGLEIK